MAVAASVLQAQCSCPQQALLSVISKENIEAQITRLLLLPAQALIRTAVVAVKTTVTTDVLA